MMILPASFLFPPLLLARFLTPPFMSPNSSLTVSSFPVVSFSCFLLFHVLSYVSHLVYIFVHFTTIASLTFLGSPFSMSPTFALQGLVSCYQSCLFVSCLPGELLGGHNWEQTAVMTMSAFVPPFDTCSQVGIS